VPADPRPKRLLYVGDSVSMTLAVGSESIAPANEVVVLNRGFLGCGLSRGDGEVKLKTQVPTESDACHDWAGRWTQALAEFQPDQTVLTLGAWDVADRKLNGDWTYPCRPEFDGWYRGLADEAVRTLTATGVPLAVTSMPYLRSDVFGLDRDEQDARVDCINSILREATSAAGIALVDLATWVCPSGECVDEVNGTTLRKDGVHYDGPGGPIAAQWIFDQVTAARTAMFADQAAVANEAAAIAAAPAGSPGSSKTITMSASVAEPTTTTTTTAPQSDDQVAEALAQQVSIPLAMPAGRVPTSRRPLRVMTVGDSLMFDAQPGMKAALESTGRVYFSNASVLGFGLARPYPWRSEWKRLIRDRKPEVIIAMWGGWDIKLYNEIGADAYRTLLDEAIGILTSGGAHVMFIGLPPSLDGWGGVAREVPRDINAFYRALPNRFPNQVTYMNPDPYVAPAGVPVLEVKQADGSWLRVRKIDFDHFCPGGAARLGYGVLTLMRPAFQLPDNGSNWVFAKWVKDSRYNDPRNACTRVPPGYVRPE
jgi:hypothetical protein